MDRTLPKKIWLAGLGALSRAEKEGDAWLEDLMHEGAEYEQERKNDLDQALLNMTERMAEGQHRARQRFGNIESAFEDKVTQALGKMGMVTRSQMNTLEQRLNDLEEQLKKPD